ncbi:PREDICTED: peritrophin-44 [Bactrocera latifrons]|uniref:peritrophin-44 n=1 Tax=Bactrocera latifrons TaxID=174628 RepID=UPI0008DCA654|nr:PREDICTED: peritrophin-44 [Bactrocera latifrons]
MEGFRLVALVTLLFEILGTVHCQQVLSTENDICRFFKDGVLLRKPGFCHIGIKCENFKSTTAIECEKDQFYNRNTNECEKTSSDKYCATACTSKTQGYIADTKNCQGWYNCKGSTTVSFGSCASNLVFNVNEGMCDYPENYSCKKKFSFCDVVPNSVPFLHETNCAGYYECVKDKLVEQSCEYGNYFDVETGTCIPRNKVNCAKYPIPDEVCGNKKLAIRNRFVSDDASCRGYFYCKDLGVGIPDTAPVWGQCSETRFFDPIEEACLPRAHVRCVDDRCDGRNDGYEISSQTGCQHYLICKGNRTSEEIYCGDDKWFDAEKNECTTTIKSYPACS